MTKTILYNYLGTNGTIQSPVHLEDIYYTRSLLLRADEGKALTKNGTDTFKTVTIAEDDLDSWKEINLLGQ